MPNSLTRNVGLRVGPILLERLVRHYFDRLKTDVQRKEGKGKGKDVQLRQDELLYDEAFHIIKVSVRNIHIGSQLTLAFRLF